MDSGALASVKSMELIYVKQARLMQKRAMMPDNFTVLFLILAMMVIKREFYRIVTPESGF